MKKMAENRYPHAATLFRFCKEALAIRYEGNVKVIDQDVGAILGYDPADCSHWKKGKKNIRALATLQSIATHLGVDERLLIDIASGTIDFDEAVFEFRGYGAMQVNGSLLEKLKKDYFRDPGKWEQPSFEESIRYDREAIKTLAGQVLALAHFEEAPVYVPEIYRHFPQFALELRASLERPFQVEEASSGLPGRFVYREATMSASTRFAAVKALFEFLVASKHSLVNPLGALPGGMVDVAGNVFAAHILVPPTFLIQELGKIDPAAEVVDQLAKGFWVTRGFMNRCLTELLPSVPGRS